MFVKKNISEHLWLKLIIYCQKEFRQKCLMQYIEKQRTTRLKNLKTRRSTFLKNKKFIELTDERDGVDVRVVADEVDGVVLSVDDVDDPVRHAGLLHEFDQGHAGRGVALRGLHDVGVAADGGHGKHPEGDHGGEVEGCDPGADAQRRAVGGQVHVLIDGKERKEKKISGRGSKTMLNSKETVS